MCIIVLVPTMLFGVDFVGGSKRVNSFARLCLQVCWSGLRRSLVREPARPLSGGVVVICCCLMRLAVWGVGACVWCRLEGAPDVASAAASNILSVVFPAADCVVGDTMGDVFDAVAEVTLGALTVSVVLSACSSTSVVITLGSCCVFGAVGNVSFITLGSCIRCCCGLHVVCAGDVIFGLVCDGAIARCRICTIWMYAFIIDEPKVRVDVCLY